MARRRKKMKYWVLVAMGLYARMIHCSILLFVVLKLREEDKKFQVDTVYMAGEENMVNGTQYKHLLEKMYDTWGP